MGTVAQLKVGAANEQEAAELLAAAMDELRRIESLATVHSSHSQLMRLNHSAGGNLHSPAELVPVDEDLNWILLHSLSVFRASEGAFNPMAGSVVRAWGFPDSAALPSPEKLAVAVGLVGGSEDLRRDAQRGAWALVRPGVELDLGGIAKGYAVDRAAEILAEGATGCLVNAGGDLAVRGTRPDGEGWLIGVQDPRDPSQLFLKLRLSGKKAVATSGDYQRYIEVDGVRYHHLIDPRTGWPAREVRSVTVIAPTCHRADAWATAAFVLGPEEGLRHLREQPEVEGVLVTVDDAGELVLHETPGFAQYREP